MVNNTNLYFNHNFMEIYYLGHSLKGYSWNKKHRKHMMLFSRTCYAFSLFSHFTDPYSLYYLNVQSLVKALFKYLLDCSGILRLEAIMDCVSNCKQIWFHFEVV